MEKIKLIIVLSVVLGIGGCKYCGNHNLSVRSFSLQAAKEEKALFLGNKSKPSIQISLSVTPHPEANKDVQFKVSGYSLVSGKGKLFNERGAEVSVGDEMKPGENNFTYVPENVAKHELHIEVSDDKGETKQSASFHLDVKQKTVRFKMDLKEMDGKKWIFPYQEANLHLDLSSVDDEANKLEYTIKTLSLGKGKLFIKGGEELREGGKLEFKGHDLIFMPNGELGSASIKMTLENEESTSNSASVAFEIKPVEFDLSSSLHIVEGSAGEQTEVSICIPLVGNDIDKEVFKVVGVEFSDGVSRKLVSAGGNDLAHSKLRTGSKYTFSWPVQKVGDGVKMKVKLEGAGGVHEKEINFSDMQRQALAKKGKEALEASKKSRAKAKDILSMKVEDNSYEEVVSGEKKLKDDIADIQKNILNLEASGLDKHELDALKKEEQELTSQLEKVEDHSKKISEKKFAFNAQLVAPKRIIFPYQQAEIDLEISSLEKENKTAVYTIKQLSLAKGKLKFADGGEVKEGVKIAFGKRKLVFEPSAKDGKENIENIEITLESDKGTSSKVKLELEVKPVEFDLKGSFELLDLEKGVVKIWIPTTGNDLDKETFKITHLAFSDSVARPLTSNLSGELRPGMKASFEMDSQKIGNGVKLRARIEGAGGVHEKEIEFSELYKGALLAKQAGLIKEIKSIIKNGDDLLLKRTVENYEEVVKGEERLQKEHSVMVAKAKKAESIGLEGTPLFALQEGLREIENKIAQLKDLVKELAKKKFAFNAQLVAPKRIVFPYQQAEVELAISSLEKENKTAVYTIKKLTLAKGKLKFADGGEVREGAKVAFGRRKLVFEPSRENGKETRKDTIEIVLESDKGTSSKAELELTVKPLDFDLKGSFELVDLAKGELKVWIPQEGNDLDKETFKLTHLEFSDGVSRHLAAKSAAMLSPGNEWKFSMNNQKIEDGVKLKARIEGAGGVYDKEIEFSELYKGVLLSKQGEILKEIRSLSKSGSDLLLKKRVENYEEVLKEEAKLQQELKERVANTKQLEAIGLERTELSALKEGLREIEDNLGQVQGLVKELAKKKFAFNVKLQVEKEETFAHIPVPLRLTLTSEPAIRKINHRVKDIVTTKGKVHQERGGEVLVGSKVDFGDNSLKFIPSGEMKEAKITITIENEQGAEESVEAVIKIKPIEYKVHVSSFDVKGQREGYGKLDLSIETDKQLEKESYKVVGWKFKKDERDRAIEGRTETEDFRRFKENMCLLVAGGREEAKIEAELRNLEEKGKKNEKDKDEAADLLKQFLGQAQEYQRKLEGFTQQVKMLEGKVEKEKTSSPGALTIATKYDTLEKVKMFEKESKEASIEKGKFEAAAFVQQEQIKRDDKTFEREMKKISERKDILLGKKKVWHEMKNVRDKKYSQEVKSELFNDKMESRGSYPLNGEDVNTLYLKLSRASMPSLLVLTVEGPGGLAKEVEVSIREGVEERVSSKAREVIKNLTDLGRTIDQKLKGDNNGQKYEELTGYIGAFEGEIKAALLPLRESYGEDWWANPSFMEIKNSKELTEIVLKTMEKLKKVEEKKEQSKSAMNSFTLDIGFQLPQGERVWPEDYLDMKLKLEDVDASMKKKVWKVLSWQCNDKAVILAGEKGKVLSEVLLSPERENKLHVKLPNLGLGYKPNLMVKVGAFDGEDLVMHNEIATNLEPWGKMLFEENVGKFIKKVEDMNKRIQACFVSKDPVDHRFDTLSNLEIEAKMLQQTHQATEGALGRKIKDVAFMLSEEIRKKVVTYADKEIPKLEESIRLLKEKKAFSQGKSGKVEELENITVPDKDGNLLLHKLAGDKDIRSEAFENIVKSTPDINVKNKEGDTPLDLLLRAYMHDDEKVKRLKLLVARGVDLNIPDEDGNFLIHRCLSTFTGEKVFEYMVKSTRDINALYGETTSVLKSMLVSYFEDSEKIRRTEFLLKNGADPNKGEGAKPLELAFKDGDNPNIDMLRLLLRYGAKPELSNGEHIMLCAVRRKKLSLVEDLLTIDKSFASVGCHIQKVYYGVERSYWTPLQVAQVYNYGEIIDVLSRAGAK